MPHLQLVPLHIYIVIMSSLFEVINIFVLPLFSCLFLNIFAMLSLICLFIYNSLSLFFFFWPHKEDNLLYCSMVISQLHIAALLFCIWHISIMEMLKSHNNANYFIAPWLTADVFLEWQTTNWPERLDHMRMKCEQYLFLLILDSYRSGKKVLHLLLASDIRGIQNEHSTNFISEDYLPQIGIRDLNFAAVNW